MSIVFGLLGRRLIRRSGLCCQMTSQRVSRIQIGLRMIIALTGLLTACQYRPWRPDASPGDAGPPTVPTTAPADATISANRIPFETVIKPQTPSDPETPPPTASQAPKDRPSTETGSSQIQPQSWQRLDTTGGGGQTGIATHPTDPNIVYMASDNGGLFKTVNGGDSWFSVSSNLGAYNLGSVTLDPLNPDIVYVTASTGSGKFDTGKSAGELYRSREGGIAWEFLSDAMGFKSSFPNQTAIVIPHSPKQPGRFDQDGDGMSDVLLIGAWAGPPGSPGGGVWRSNDEGQTFVQIALQGQNVAAVRAFEGDPDTLFLATYEGKLYTSSDQGKTWADITGNLPLPHLADVAVHPENKDILYVTCRPCAAGKRPVWQTNDGGQRWKAASYGLDSTTSRAFPRILIDRLDPNTFYVSTFDGQRGVYKGTKTVLGGIRWRPMPFTLILPDGRPYHAHRFHGGLTIAQAIDGTLFAGGSGGWRYPAGSHTPGQDSVPRERKVWEPATMGVGNVHVNTIQVDPRNDAVLYQGISDRGPYKSTDRGASFHRILGTGWPVTVKNFVWNGPYFSNYKMCQPDSNRNECSEECTARGQLASGGTTDFGISHQDSNIVYSSFGSGSNRSLRGGINKSTDGGKTWQPVGFQTEPRSPENSFELNPETCLPYGFRHVAVDPRDDRVVLAAMENPTSWEVTLYKTTDGGATWNSVLKTPGTSSGIEISIPEPGVVLVATRTDIWMSAHGGAAGSFQRITPDTALQIESIALSPHQPGVYVIGTRTDGLYYTSDSGSTWTNNRLDKLFDRQESPDGSEDLASGVATAFNPNVSSRRHVSAVVFDPQARDTFYVGTSLRPRAGCGIARLTNSAQNWEQLPLEGLTHRNIYALAIDSAGEYLYAGTNDGTFRLQLIQ